MGVRGAVLHPPVRPARSRSGGGARFASRPGDPVRDRALKEKAMMLMPFGRYRGQPISSLPETYLRWLVTEPQGWSARVVTPALVEAGRTEFAQRGRREGGPA